MYITTTTTTIATTTGTTTTIGKMVVCDLTFQQRCPQTTFLYPVHSCAVVLVTC